MAFRARWTVTITGNTLKYSLLSCQIHCEIRGRHAWSGTRCQSYRYRQRKPWSRASDKARFIPYSCKRVRKAIMIQTNWCIDAASRAWDTVFSYILNRAIHPTRSPRWESKISSTRSSESTRVGSKSRWKCRFQICKVRALNKEAIDCSERFLTVMLPLKTCCSYLIGHWQFKTSCRLLRIAITLILSGAILLTKRKSSTSTYKTWMQDRIEPFWRKTCLCWRYRSCLLSFKVWKRLSMPCLVISSQQKGQDSRK